MTEPMKWANTREDITTLLDLRRVGRIGARYAWNPTQRTLDPYGLTAPYMGLGRQAIAVLNAKRTDCEWVLFCSEEGVVATTLTLEAARLAARMIWGAGDVAT